MACIEWTEQLVVGHEGIDRDHRQLADMVNDASSALDDSDLVLFEEHVELLQRHALSHIEYEERLMRESGYEQGEPHEHSHRSLMAQMEVFNSMIGQGLFVIGREAVEFLRDWLVVHIEKCDRPLADHLRHLESIERGHCSCGI